MTIQLDDLPEVYEQSIKNYHMLMSRRVKAILVVASLYDACIINQERRLEDRIAALYREHEHVRPPALTWAHSADQALHCLEAEDFDLVIMTLQFSDAQAGDLAAAIKTRSPKLPVLVLVHDPLAVMYLRQGMHKPTGVDQVFAWTHDSDQVMAMIRYSEDLLNVEQDNQRCGVPVILLVSTGVRQTSVLAPVVFREMAIQTERRLGDTRDDEIRLLLGKARPRVVIANDYREAVRLSRTFQSSLMGAICVLSPDDADAENQREYFQWLQRQKATLPCLLLTAGAPNATAQELLGSGAAHADLGDSVRALSAFFSQHLGFGDLEMRDDQGEVVARAGTIGQLETLLTHLPAAVLARHVRQQDITRWLYARGELLLAQRLQALELSEAVESTNGDLPQALETLLRVRRINRQQETIADFDRQAFDGQPGFYRIGRGSMGGKARGLLFLASQLQSPTDWRCQFPQVDITVPGALVVATDVFDAFVEANGLQVRSRTQMGDKEIAARFLAAPLPAALIEDLEAYLVKVDHPLAVRSSSLLEDSLSRPYAGIYRTYMLPNDHPDRQVRLTELLAAIKLVYASTFFEEPRAFAKRTQQQPDEEKMAVVIQGLVGRVYGDLYLPAISGVVQSYNYYPMAPMQPDDGIANIAAGLGKAVVGGERTLRFCPRYPQHLPQFSSVDDILDNAQRYYYGLRMQASPLELGIDADAHLVKREVGEDDPPELMRLSASTYLPEEHRIKDTVAAGGYPVITFAPLLKYDALPLAEILSELLDVGRRGLGRAVDIEFCLDFPADGSGRPQLSILQIRPMADRGESATVAIQNDDRKHAFCYSENALGNGVVSDLTDIVFVKPADFDPAKTSEIAKEIARMNAELAKAGRRYLLIGPGRWGSADPWLGIPVNWADISGAAVIVETTHAAFNADPSQGSHFFHNMTSLGMSYLNITAQSEDFIKPGWFASHPVMRVTRFLSHIRLERPVIVKVDGRSSRGILRDSR